MARRVLLRFILCAAIAAGLRAQTFTTIFTFDGSDGFNPGGLTLGVDGNLYGTTFNQQGTIFKITPTGVLTTLFDLCPGGSNCPNGVDPDGVLVQAANGDFYGTTAWGGAFGYGTIYRITPAGVLTTLHSFCAQSGCPDGANPNSLTRAADGNYYGTTAAGGTGSYCYFSQDVGCGSVFRITPRGDFTTLYSFCFQSACTDGAVPGPLIQADDGSFYGIAGGGGSAGLGTFFRITAVGILTTVYNFDLEASYPNGLMQAADGEFYGTATYGGVGSSGSIFRITRGGAFSTVYSFRCSAGGCADGVFPNSGLIQASDGNFYGTTANGGGNQKGDHGGTIFKVTPRGTLTTLHVFCAHLCPGIGPVAGLVQAPDGIFYGTFEAGEGAIFSLSVGLGPFVKPQPTFGKPGSVVQILGTNLSGASRVTFNGTAAAFRVVSSSLIMATVPAGATNGEIQVVTPSGTLAGDVPFVVWP